MIGNSTSEVFFIALHGSWGEDGRLQAALDLMGRVYTGSGPTACALAMDKRASKALFVMEGVPTPEAVYLLSDEAADGGAGRKTREALERWKRIVIKPSGCGSTVGVTIVFSEPEIEEALSLAFSFDRSVIVEEYIPGREIPLRSGRRTERQVSSPLSRSSPAGGSTPTRPSTLRVRQSISALHRSPYWRRNE